MSNFDKLRAEANAKHEPNIGGTFECFECGERVRGAFYDRGGSLLTWVCSKGHTSDKEFHID